MTAPVQAEAAKKMKVSTYKIEACFNEFSSKLNGLETDIVSHENVIKILKIEIFSQQIKIDILLKENATLHYLCLQENDELKNNCKNMLYLLNHHHLA